MRDERKLGRGHEEGKRTGEADQNCCSQRVANALPELVL